jgi:hypothetical protein
MDTEGTFAPDTAEQAREQYESLESAAKGVVREVARAMALDGDEYNKRVTDDVIQTAQNALFASLLEVNVGTRAEFEAWKQSTDHTVVEAGSEHVDGVAWHAPPFAEMAVAATYQDKQEAAVDTLRRQVFGRLYREILSNT